MGVNQLEQLIDVYGESLDPRLKERVSTIIGMCRDNDRSIRLYGATETKRERRTDFVSQFNQFMLPWTGHSFNDLAMKELNLPEQDL